MSYKIRIIRSGLGRFTWHLLINKYNGGSTKIAEAPQMFTNKHVVDKTTGKLAKLLKCSIEFVDLGQDYEE